MDPIILTAIGGTTLLILLVFQVLVGLRKIKFKGATHLRVHRTTAYVMLAAAAFHATFALGKLVFGWF